MWSLLYNNNIINIPLLFDISSIYGQSYKKELEVIFNELFTCQNLYIDNLKNFTEVSSRVVSCM